MIIWLYLFGMIVQAANKGSFDAIDWTLLATLYNLSRLSRQGMAYWSLTGGFTRKAIRVIASV